MRSKRSQVASFVANVKVIYSASVEDKVIIDCLLEYQLIRPSLSIKMKLNIDFRFFLSPI